MSRFAIQQIKANGVYYAGQSGWLVNDGVQVDSQALDGLNQETAHHGVLAAPTADIQTRNLAILSALSTSSIIPYLTIDGVNGLVLVGAKQSTGAPGYLAGTVHAARSSLNGALYATSLRWSKGGKAELALRGMFLSADGTAAALSKTSVALPTQPVPDYGWTLTSFTAGGSPVPTIDSLDLTINPKCEFEYQYGLPQPIGITGAGPRGAVEIRLQANVGDCDLGEGTGACSFVLTKLANGGGLSGHTATFTLNSTWSLEDSIGGQAGSPMARVLTCRPVWDGTNNALSWTIT